MENFINDIANKTNAEVLQFCFEQRLIRESPECDYCNEPKPRMFLKKTKDCKDGFNYRCMNSSCSKYQTTTSLRKGSWFDSFGIELKLILKFLKYYALGMSQTTLVQCTAISLRTVKRLCSKMQESITNHYRDLTFRIGGPGVVVQVDETMLNHKVKSHRGRGPRTQTWACCLVDTSSTPAKGYAEVVPDRKKTTLMNVITRVVRDGSEVHTDEWKGYNDIAVNNYTHHRITHKFNFVDPKTGVHTQHVESFNNKIKRKIKKEMGVASNKRNEFLQRYMFFEHNKNSEIVALLNLFKL